ncbi:MAG: hypothetical protein Q9171_004609 [Xanthocarpia ochracea]
MASKPTAFPSLKSAFVQTLHINYANIAPIGRVYTGSECMYISIDSGSIVSVEGFEPKLDLKLVSGSDYLYFDPGEEKKARLNVKAVFRTPEGTMVALTYTGCIHINEAVQKIFEGQPATCPFGLASMQNPFFSFLLHHPHPPLSFELGTGDPKYKFLEDGTWVANGRFVFEDGQLAVESRSCQVIPSHENPPGWKA